MPDQPRPKGHISLGEVGMDKLVGELTVDAKAEVVEKLIRRAELDGMTHEPGPDGVIDLGEVGVDQLMGELTPDAKSEIIEKLIRRDEAAARSKPVPKK
jgi:hypothetical protein